MCLEFSIKIMKIWGIFSKNHGVSTKKKCLLQPHPPEGPGICRAGPPQRADAAVIAAHGAIIAAVHLADLGVSGGGTERYT